MSTSMTRAGMAASGTLPLLCSIALLLAAGCGGGGKGGAAGGEVATGAGGKALKTAGGNTINLRAHNQWKAAVAAFKAAKKQGWNDSRCDSVAEKFEEAAEINEKFAEALYMAGVAHAQCGRSSQAVSFYNKALRQNSKLCKARAGLGVEQMRSNNTSAALREFQGAVRDDPQCTEAYVNIAIIQRMR